MNVRERIQGYLFSAGLDALAHHAPVIDKAVQDFIEQLSTPMDVSVDALYRYPVPKLADDGACSLIDDIDPTPYDLAAVLGGVTEANTRRLKLANILVNRASMVTGADWVGIYAARPVRGARMLVKLAYRGRPSRAEFPLTEEFARASTNSRVGLSGRAVCIADVAAHRAAGGGFYVCDEAVQSEFCLPLFDETGAVTGIIDAEAAPAAFFNADRQAALVALALVAPSVLP
jgi:putative methionine-R-sulfoxide reductase with GAF domain